MTLLSYADDLFHGDAIADLAKQAGINRFTADEFFLLARSASPATWDF